MKKFFIILFKSLSIVLLFVSTTNKIVAQEDYKHKVEAYKIAYLTEKLDLTTQEAEKFWPLYNEFNKKEDSIRVTQRRTMMENYSKIDELSDEELENLVDNFIIHQQKMADLHKYYHQRFKEILPIKKVAKLYAAEHEFKKILVHQLKGHGYREHRGPGHGPRPDYQEIME